MLSFLTIMQSIYGNVARPLATLEPLGAWRLDWSPAEVKAALEARQDGQGRLVTARVRRGRWAVFLKGK